jgi:hypothetical protein
MIWCMKEDYAIHIMMCQRFSGHKVKQHFAASRSQRVIYIH